MPKVRLNEFGLTPREALFCEYYIGNLNGTQSYRLVSPESTYGTARSKAAKLLARDNIQAYIKQLKEQRLKELQITPDFLIAKSMEVYAQAMAAKPVMKYNFDTKELEETGTFVFDGKAANGAIDNIIKITGFNSTSVKTTIDAKIEETRKSKSELLAESLFGDNVIDGEAKETKIKSVDDE